MKRIKFGNYAGVSVKGKSPITSLNVEGGDLRHIDKAEWLTAMVESGGYYGTVMNYDGTGMTAGVHQAIAVYPRQLLHADGISVSSQGPLWKLLKRIESVAQHEDAWADLIYELEDSGFYLSPEGKLRMLSNGKLVDGARIRYELTGSPDGVMPLKGANRDRAEKYVGYFSRLFSSPVTFQVQRQHGLEHFTKRAERTKLRFSQSFSNMTIEEAVYGEDHIAHVLDSDLGYHVDLAMSMFWSNTVNAPGAALKRLCRVARFACGKRRNPEKFAKELIKKLGNTKFGRWDDDIPNGRYQRTRRYAMKFWPKELFVGKDAIMPKDLPG